MERKRILLVSDVHYCQRDFYGIDRDTKAARTISLINDEYKKDPYEAVLFLGDFSLDHWAHSTGGAWLSEGKSYTQEFIEKYCPQIPTPYYLVSGNHEQFGAEKWKEITGFDRNCHVVVGDFLLVLWDSFGANPDPDYHSDGTYKDIDVKAVRKLMDEYPDTHVILCSHHFEPSGRPEEIELFNDKRIVCAFRGHTHRSDAITLPKEYGSKLLIQTGNWSKRGGKHALEVTWGLRDLYLDNDSIRTRYIVQENDLIFKGEKVHIDYRYQDEIEISLK